MDREAVLGLYSKGVGSVTKVEAMVQRDRWRGFSGGAERVKKCWGWKKWGRYLKPWCFVVCEIRRE